MGEGQPVRHRFFLDGEPVADGLEMMPPTPYPGGRASAYGHALMVTRQVLPTASRVTVRSRGATGPSIATS